MLPLHFLIKNKVNLKAQHFFSLLFWVLMYRSVWIQFPPNNSLFPIISQQGVSFLKSLPQRGPFQEWVPHSDLRDTSCEMTQLSHGREPAALWVPHTQDASTTPSSLNLPLNEESLWGLIWFKIKEGVILAGMTGFNEKKTHLWHLKGNLSSVCSDWVVTVPCCFARWSLWCIHRSRHRRGSGKRPRAVRSEPPGEARNQSLMRPWVEVSWERKAGQQLMMH